ncbi:MULTISPECIES: hypothetical protein [Bacillati]|uniref:hypothetical protein n=1 Tax=Bacillati TaxID=1783272 RepID=UPI000B9C2DE7|nr:MULTISPECIES: hypothetical protein [Terrabacteria group]MED3677060.1 hypothetical protein [Bacillus velezensis]OZE89098.1 hypothetical protein CH302_29460 [Rhodococcus sp. 15-2388-1-1a]
MEREEVMMKKKRKTRSDKKRDVKPTISYDLKQCIYRLSYITNTPVKDVVEILCEKGLKSKKVIDQLSKYFRRNLQYRNTFYMGDSQRESLQRKNYSVHNERITTRFSQQTFENIKSLSDALDVTPTMATALLLNASVKNTNIINAFVKHYLSNEIDAKRMKELKQVLKFINKNNPYEQELSWFSLFSMIHEEVQESTQNIKKAIGNWLDKHIR